MKIKKASIVKLRGDLSIEVFDTKTLEILKTFCIRNTITYNGLNSMLYLWAQDGVTLTDYQFARLVPGTNATPPTRGDLSLGAPLGPADQIVLAPANRTPNPTTGELVITGTLTSGQGNTAPGPLVEIGLELANGQLFARQVHPGISKNIAFGINYTWRFAVTTTS